jgi:hypothetical protein
MRLSHSLVGLDLRRRYRVPLCRVSARHILCLWTTSPGVRPCSWFVIQLHDRVVLVLEEFVLEAGGTKGRELWLEARRIRSGASRDRLRDVVLFDLGPHTGTRRLVVT